MEARIAVAGRFRTVLGGAVVALALLVPVHAAEATTYVVNSTEDGSDTDLNDPACDGSNPGIQCTLRAAVDQADANPGPDDVAFEGTVFTGNVATSTISSNGNIFIESDLTIDGGNCGATSADQKPCVGLDLTGVAGVSALIVAGDSGADPDVVIRGLAVTNASGGIDNNAADGSLKVTGSWLGLKLDESAGGNVQAGIFVSAFPVVTIGGDTPPERNVIANNGTGVRSFGDRGRISGNYFGTLPDGTTLARNSRDILITGSTISPATGNVIGGTPSAAEAASPECDGPCNVLAGTRTGNAPALDLNGVPDGFVQPASEAVVAGNFIGLDATGTAETSSFGTGIFVGDADEVVVGGESTARRNYIGGVQTGIFSSQGARRLRIQNNFLGMNSAGTSPIPNGTLAAQLAKGTFKENRVGGDGVFPPVGLQLNGNQQVVQGNVFGIGTNGASMPFDSAAIQVQGTNNVIGGGGAGTGNKVISAGTAFALVIDGGDGNEVRGNEIGLAGKGSTVGVEIENDADGNKIGGESASEENVFTGNGDAIEVSGNGSDQNRLLRNRGSDNTGLFFDLSPPDGPGNDPSNGPNNGIEAPTVVTASTTTATGTSRPGAVIRLFRVRADGQNILGFAGQTTANATSGNWTVVYGAPIPSGQRVAASQTKKDHSSELSGFKRIP